MLSIYEKRPYLLAVALLLFAPPLLAQEAQLTKQNGVIGIREGKSGAVRAINTIYTVQQVRSINTPRVTNGPPVAITTVDFGGGTWRLDPDDTSTPDNTGTVLVTASGLRYKRIVSGAVDATWFCSGNGIADDKISLQKAVDFAASINAFLLDTGQPTYRITGGILLKTGLAGIRLNGIISASGAAYTAVNTQNTFRYKAFKIQVEGNGNKINGILLNNPLITDFESIRVHNCNGFGLKIIKSFDNVFYNVSIELCGNNDNYAYSMHGADDTSNMTNTFRLQVERSREKAIYIEGSTLSSIFQNIHSERQTVSGQPKDTWYFGGASTTYQNLRLHAETGKNLAQAHFYGAQLTVNDLRAENIPIIAESWAEGAAQVVFNQINAQSFSRAGNGEVIVDKGYIHSSSGPTNRLIYQNVTINTLTVGNAPNEKFPVTLFNCWVKNLTSNSNLSFVKAIDSQFDAGDFPAGAIWLTRCSFKFGDERVSRRRVYANDCELIGNITTELGHFEFRSGTKLIGNLTIGSGRSCLFDPTSYVTGSVSNMGPPETSTYAGGFFAGQRIYNPKATLKGVDYWICIANGTNGNAGTWIPVYNN